MEIVRRERTVKFCDLERGTIFLAHGSVPYMKLHMPVKIEGDTTGRSYGAVHLTGHCLSAITQDTSCIPIKGKFVEDDK